MSLKVTINNFQSIASTTLSFEGYSCIVGQSDMGKSAVRRAITTALFNYWDKSFIRTNTKQTQISLQHNNTAIQVLKGKTDNQFTINGKTMPKMGRDAPDLPTYNQDLNITTQLEPLYMVAYKDTENTKILNDMFGVTKIETAQQLCNQDNRRLKDKIKIYQEQLDEIQSNIKQQELTTLELQEVYSHLKEVTDLQTLLQDYSKIKQQCKELESQVKEASASVDSTDAKIEALDRLKVALFYMSLLSKKAKIKDRLESIPSYARVKGIKSLARYNELIYATRNLSVYLAERTADIEQVEKKLSQYTCPTCKQPISSCKN